MLPLPVGGVLGLLLAAILFFALEVASSPAPINSITMKVFNHAGAPIELFWIDTYSKDGKLVRQTQKPIRNNTDTSIHSYNGHSFMVKFLNHIEGSETTFTKGPREEKIMVTYDPISKKMSTRITTKFNEVMDAVGAATRQCSISSNSRRRSIQQQQQQLLEQQQQQQQQQQQAVGVRGEGEIEVNEPGGGFEVGSVEAMEAQFSECVANEIIEDINKLQDSKTQLTKYRDMMSERLRNYTCADDTMESSPALETHYYNIMGKNYKINSLMDLPNAKIWTVDNFVSEEECAVLEKHGRPRLRRATVAAEDGTSIVSENRKANQASYDFGQNPDDDPLRPLFYRILHLTNHHTRMSLRPPGQESFTIIQYNQEDQYSPHCDGGCDGTDHVPTGRVATAVMYCKVADRGGGTTFSKADLFVKPRRGQATFFSYKGEDGKMDEGYTEHSGCPVLEGEKWITTLWMREGVDAEHTWERYDPSGNPILFSDSMNE